MHNYSGAIDNDTYFETVLTSSFRVTSEKELYQAHAGSKSAFEPDHKKGFLKDHHRYIYNGGSVSSNAPFGTFNEPTDYGARSQVSYSEKGSQYK